MTLDEIQTIWDRFHTPEHVMAHCQQVARVGKFLAEILKSKGHPVNPELVWQAGLLHDVVRVVDFKTLNTDLGSKEDQSVWNKLRNQHKGRHHADVGGEILEAMGELRLGDIIRRHRYSALGTPEGPQDLESKLVYYADKRVAHTEIVPLEDRLNEGHQRHFPGSTLSEKDLAQHARVLALEEELFKDIPFDPHELAERIQ